MLATDTVCAVWSHIPAPRPPQPEPQPPTALPGNLSSLKPMRQGSRSPALSNKQLFEQMWLQAKGKFHFLLQKTWFLLDPTSTPHPASLLTISVAGEGSGYKFSSSGNAPLPHTCSCVSESPWRDPTCGHSSMRVAGVFT